jgi:hypothetical protein
MKNYQQVRAVIRKAVTDGVCQRRLTEAAGIKHKPLCHFLHGSDMHGEYVFRVLFALGWELRRKTRIQRPSAGLRFRRLHGHHRRPAPSADQT